MSLDARCRWSPGKTRTAPAGARAGKAGNARLSLISAVILSDWDVGAVDPGSPIRDRSGHGHRVQEGRSTIGGAARCAVPPSAAGRQPGGWARTPGTLPTLW